VPLFSRLFILTLILLFFPGGTVPGLADILLIPGTGDSQALLRRLGDVFDAENQSLVIIPESIGSSGGIRQVMRGKAVLARVARELTDAEKDAGLHWRQFAFSPVVFAVHIDQENIVDITDAQVEGVFTGRMTDWAQLGSSGGKIYLAEREAGDSSRNVLRMHFKFFRDRPGPVGKVLYSTPEMVKVLSRHRHTLGYLPLSSLTGTSIRALSLNGVEPTAASMREGRYPLWTPLALVWRGALKPEAKKFLDFLFTPKARGVMTSFGVVPTER